MAIQPPGFLKPPFKRPPLLLKWIVTGVVVDNLNRGVADIVIQVKNKVTNEKVDQATTGADGRFTFNLFLEEQGYRVTPFHLPYTFCPGYQDVYGNADLNFRCIK